jgi:sugar phosphate isomerase/epimerase
MKFCIRRNVHFDDFDRWFSGLKGIPLELALPHDMQEFWSVVGRFGELAAYVRDNGFLVNSVDAPHGRLSGNAFMAWGPQVTRLAERTGAGLVVYHPEGNIARVRKPRFQATALGNIKALQGRTPVTVAIETFGKKSRIFTPSEIMEHSLPMVLDTGHVDEGYAFELIEQYSGNIVAVHLSANSIDPTSGRVMNHLPVESYGIEVLKALQARGWNGTVTLEYLPDYNDGLFRRALQKKFG